MTDFALEQKLQLAEKTIEQLRRERDNALARDIHSCDENCTRDGCVNVQLRRELEEAKQRIAELEAGYMSLHKDWRKLNGELVDGKQQLAIQALEIGKLRSSLIKARKCLEWVKHIRDTWGGKVSKSEVEETLGNIREVISFSTPDYTKLLAERDAALLEKAVKAVWSSTTPRQDLRDLAAKIRAGEEV